MKVKRKQSGVTLIEMIVVVAIVAMLAVFVTPAIRTFLGSMATQGSTRAMIGAALSSARAIAIKEHRYAGIRFQKIYDPNNIVKSSQYMILIIHDTSIPPSKPGNLACRAVKKVQPIMLPANIGVMDLILGSLKQKVTLDDDIDENDELIDVTTFSVLFSPSGKLVIHTHKVEKVSDTDDIFNSASNIENGMGMFLQDKESSIQPINEISRRGFYLYDREEFKKVSDDERWSKYLRKLDLVNINTYTGRIISTD